MIEVPLNKIKENIIELIDKASKGEDVLITKDENPFVKITSATKKPRAVFGSAKKKILYISDDFDKTPEEFNEYLK